MELSILIKTFCSSRGRRRAATAAAVAAVAAAGAAATRAIETFRIPLKVWRFISS